jgi:hypothetical protein
VEGLRLWDYIPPEIVEKAKIAAEKDNQFVVDDCREKRKRQGFRKTTQATKQTIFKGH